MFCRSTSKLEEGVRRGSYREGKGDWQLAWWLQAASCVSFWELHCQAVCRDMSLSRFSPCPSSLLSSLLFHSLSLLLLTCLNFLLRPFFFGELWESFLFQFLSFSPSSLYLRTLLLPNRLWSIRRAAAPVSALVEPTARNQLSSGVQFTDWNSASMWTGNFRVASSFLHLLALFPLLLLLLLHLLLLVNVLFF